MQRVRRRQRPGAEDQGFLLPEGRFDRVPQVGVYHRRLVHHNQPGAEDAERRLRVRGLHVHPRSGLDVQRLDALVAESSNR